MWTTDGMCACATLQGLAPKPDRSRTRLEQEQWQQQAYTAHCETAGHRGGAHLEEGKGDPARRLAQLHAYHKTEGDDGHQAG